MTPMLTLALGVVMRLTLKLTLVWTLKRSHWRVTVRLAPSHTVFSPLLYSVTLGFPSLLDLNLGALEPNSEGGRGGGGGLPCDNVLGRLPKILDPFFTPSTQNREERTA